MRRAYRAFATSEDELGDTEAVYRRILCLPIYNDLEVNDVDRVCEMVLDFYRHYPSP